MQLLITDNLSPGAVGHYRIDSGRRMRIEEYQGKVGLLDLRSVIAAMASDPGWSPHYHGLVDFSAADLDLSSNDVLRLGLMLRLEQNRTKGWQVFVVTNSTAYGIVRMLGYWARTTARMRIFNDRDEAERWLELNVDQVPPNFLESDEPNLAAILRTAI